MWVKIQADWMSQQVMLSVHARALQMWTLPTMLTLGRVAAIPALIAGGKATNWDQALPIVTCRQHAYVCEPSLEYMLWALHMLCSAHISACWLTSCMAQPAVHAQPLHPTPSTAAFLAGCTPWRAAQILMAKASLCVFDAPLLCCGSFTCCMLPAACCVLPAACCLLLAACSLVLARPSSQHSRHSAVHSGIPNRLA